MEAMEGMKGELNLTFTKGFSGLYFIKDSISDIRISGFMEFPTEAHACMSFCQFIEQQQQKNKLDNIDCYKLILAAKLNDADIIFEVCYKEICNGDNCEQIRKLYVDAYKALYEVEENV